MENIQIATEEQKKQVIELLAPYYTMATLRQGFPRCRPMGLVKLVNGKLYSGVIPTKSLYREICDDPHMEFSNCPDGKRWVRVRGLAVWETDPEIIAQMENIIKADMEEKFGRKLPDRPSDGHPATQYFYLDQCIAEVHDGANIQEFCI